MQLRPHASAWVGASIWTTLKVCLSSLALVTAADASTPTAAQINTSRANGLAWLYKTQQGDGSWRSSAGLQVQSTSAVLDAMMNAGVFNGSAFFSGVSSLSNAHPSSTDGQARQIMTLYRAGINVSAHTNKLLSQATGAYGAWGTLPGYGNSVLDTAMASVALIGTTPSWTGYGNLVCNVIVPQQRTGGGWSYMGGLTTQPSNEPTNASKASIVPTVYAILNLRLIGLLGYSQFTCGTTTYTTATLMNNGVAFLKTKLNSDGGFGESGTSGALETALVYLAINSVNTSDSTLGNAQGYLVSTQKSDGSWADDPFQTALALQTYPQTTLASTAGDGIPDVVKTALNINVNTKTGSLKPGNGQSVAGVNKPLLSLAARVGDAMSSSLSSSTLVTLSSGNLPPGLVLLQNNGVLSGTPTTAGTYSFVVQQKDLATSNISYVDVQVVVSGPVDVADAPTLPEWGAIVMALVLMGSMAVQAKRQRR